MTEKHKCAAKCYSNWTWYACGKTAKMTHDGKHYCGIHDPVKTKAKQLARDKAYREKRDTENAARKAIDDRRKLGEAAIAALEMIAKGYNDARRLAVEVLAGKK